MNSSGRRGGNFASACQSRAGEGPVEAPSSRPGPGGGTPPASTSAAPGASRRVDAAASGGALGWARSRVVAAAVVAAVGCSGSRGSSSTPADYDPNVARYRLLLRHNPVDPGEAFRCYGRCQSEKTPQGYLRCLTECPAFEVDQGLACKPSEVPPIAACITARRLDIQKDELAPGYVVVATILSIALVVSAASACVSSINCGGNYYYVPLGSAGPPVLPF